MSHFYGTLKGTRGEATRCGDKARGLSAIAAGWGGAIDVFLYTKDTGGILVDWFDVRLIPWQNSGGNTILLASGPLSAKAVQANALVLFHPALVIRFTEAEATRIMTEEK